MKEKYELNDEELSKVTGGATDCDNKSFSGHVAQHDAEKETYYFCVNDGTNNWFAGKCVDSWEATYAVFFSKRTHKLNVVSKGSCYWVTEGAEKEIWGEDWTLFKYMNGRTVQQCMNSNNWN